MNRSAYYEDLKVLAREKRNRFGIDTAAFGLREVRQIYKHENVQIDYWPLAPKVKALYMCADGDCSVAIQRNLPDEPKLFALVHELKHHYRDREALGNDVISCGDYNANEIIEIGAEVFAAEFIYPETEFAADIVRTGIEQWTPDRVVHFKMACKAKVSYTYLCKRLEWLRLIERGQFNGIKFRKLEEELYGVPFYRRRYRARA